MKARMQRLLFTLILILFLANAPVFGESYRIREGDTLIIAIIGQPEYTQTVQVREDGMMSYFGGDLHVAGKTADTVNQYIRDFLVKHELVRNPVIMVSPVPQENGIFVGGAVTTPGRYVISPNANIGLYRAIALAGGMAENADVQQVQLIRAKGKESEAVVETYELSINRPYRNISVNVADLVYVMPMSAVEVQGEIKVPGKLFIRGKIDVAEALAKAGGLTEEADLTALVKVSRDGNLSEFSLPEQFWKPTGTPKNLNAVPPPSLSDGDVLFVPNAFKVTPIYIIGYVQAPGAQRVRGPVTLAQAIALAGGFEDLANRENVIIHRRDGSSIEHPFVFNYKGAGSNTREDLVLLYPGDILEVDKRFQVNWGLVSTVTSTALGIISFIIAFTGN